MQEDNEKNKAEWSRWINKKALYPVCVCFLLFLAALVTGLYLYRDLPTAHWRESHTDFPWTDNGVSIASVKSHWQNSRGNARMELRAAFYPAATVTLGENPKGKGLLIVRFLDDNATPCGQAIYLPYDENGFVFKEDTNILAKDKEAALHSEQGFRTKEDFYNHALSEDRPLWRVCVWNRAQGSTADAFMGYITIPATDKEP